MLIEKLLYTWRSEWVSEFESPWGILEKFRFANELTINDIFSLFGNDYIKKPKSGSYWRSKSSRNLITLQGLSDDNLEYILGIKVIERNKQTLERIFCYLRSDDFNSPSFHNLMREHIVFCPDCIKNGHHSIFHQVKFLAKCPYHDTLLIHECPKCATKYPYELSSKLFTRPFMCECGYSFIGSQLYQTFFRDWNRDNIPALQASNILRWLC